MSVIERLNAMYTYTVLAISEIYKPPKGGLEWDSTEADVDTIYSCYAYLMMRYNVNKSRLNGFSQSHICSAYY